MVCGHGEHNLHSGFAGKNAKAGISYTPGLAGDLRHWRKWAEMLAPEVLRFGSSVATAIGRDGSENARCWETHPSERQEPTLAGPG